MMNPLRRSFLKLFGGAMLSVPARALAEPIRILPGADVVNPAPTGSGRSPELQRALAGLVAGPATTQGALSAIWLQSPPSSSRPPLQIITLDEARAASTLTVTERALASVPELIAENRGKVYVLLLAGEILIGGKQNRILREDLLLPPLSGPRNIGVYCVEQGRWNEGRKDFESRSSLVQPTVRSEVIGKAPQSRIWSGVAAASRELRASSPTGSYQAIYDKPEVKAHLGGATRRLDPSGVSEVVGAAVFVGSELAGVDCFHSPALFAREWPKLLRAYALDAYGGASGWDETAGRGRVEGLLRGAAQVEGALRGNAGVGQLFEFGIGRGWGAALIFENAVVHLAIL
jgi:ARG/rhodanese/phosphatase superfamily protein